MNQSTHAIAAVCEDRDRDERITSDNASVDGRKSNVVVRCMAEQFGLVQSPNCYRTAPLNTTHWLRACDNLEKTVIPSHCPLS